MRRAFFASLSTLTLVALPVFGQPAAPVGVSPGGISSFAAVSSGCPTFSWSEVGDSPGYELVVYRMNDDGEGAEPELRQLFPPSSSSWTPSLEQCMEPGARYAWSVRAVQENGEPQWSQPRLFIVAGGTGSSELGGRSRSDHGRNPSQRHAEDGEPAVPEVVSASPGGDATLDSSPRLPNAAAATALDVEGGVVADSFTGDGSTLENLDAANITAGGTADIDISGDAVGLSATLPVADGGTGATDAGTARTNLDAASHTDFTTHAGNADAHHAPPTALPPSGVAGGDLTGAYPNPAVVDTMARDAEVSSAIASHTGTADAHHAPPTALPPSGVAGGDLTGTYPNPAVVDTMARDAEVTSAISSHTANVDAHHTPTINTDTLASLMCADGQIAKWDTSGGAWVCGDDEGALVSTIVVSPVGTDTENGTALRNVLNGISSSSTNRFLVKVEPGVYNVGTQYLTVKSFVELEGAGIEATEIKGTVHGSGTTAPHGLIEAQNRSAVRRLTVRNEPAWAGSSYKSAGIYARVGNGHQVHVDNVRVINDANGATFIWGILMEAPGYNSVVWLHDVEILVQDAAYQYGLYDTESNYALPVGSDYPRWVLNDVHIESLNTTQTGYGFWGKNTNVEMRDVSVLVAMNSTGSTNRGIAYDGNSHSHLEMDGVSVRMRGAAGYGTATGLDIRAPSSILQNVSVDIADFSNPTGMEIYADDDALTVAGAAIKLRDGEYGRGIKIDGGSPRIIDSRIDVRGMTEDSYGLDLTSSFDVPVLRGVSVYSSATTSAYGLHAYAYGEGEKAVIQNSRLVATTATNTFALYSRHVDLDVHNSYLAATAATNAHGVFLEWYDSGYEGQTVIVEGAQVQAATAVAGDTAYTVNVGASSLDGTVTAGGATLTCVSSWNGSFTALTSSCL